MGDMADDLDRQMERAVRCARYAENMYGKVWITKEGKQILQKDMTDKHLLSTIAMLERKGKYSRFYPSLHREAASRGLLPTKGEKQ